ncbi:MAG: chloride channel protein [Acidimicrobiales bacterium]
MSRPGEDPPDPAADGDPATDRDPAADGDPAGEAADISPGPEGDEPAETTAIEGVPEKPPGGGGETYLGPDWRPSKAKTAERALGDFTTTPSVLRLVPLAIAIGVLGAGISLALLVMIGFLTNLLYYQRLSYHLASPNANTLGAIAILIPVGGGLIVGLMARYGSEQIRGHGIPEAMENILITGSKVQPRLAILKPISSAISIGTGGPFGAEGPIIMTGGAVGSIIGQLFRLTAAQRRALLVAGAAAGMSAVFGTPVAATLFGVELLVFEFKPRSMVLIGLAAATADGLRMAMAAGGLVLPQPLFPIPGNPPLGGVVLLGAAAIGLATGLGAWVMTQAVYTCEDLFKKLTGHLHWMWWPIIGGLIIGLGGLVDPRALGVGYNTIHAELLGQLGIGALILLFIVKMIIWAGGLGGGTSGGILAPILMMGAAIGGVMGHGLPGASISVFALIGMSGALAGVTRSPFTAVIFAFELTHDSNSLLALLVAATISHLVSVLVLKRSILTEKVARRGFHVMREYAVDPLEATFVREVMDTDVSTVEPGRDISDLHRALPEGSRERRQRLYPVLDAGDRLVGILPWSKVLAAADRPGQTVEQAMIQPMAVAHPDEILRLVADRMVAFGVGVIPVVDRADPRRLDGLISQFDLLTARQKLLEEERHAERVLTLRRVRRQPQEAVPGRSEAVSGPRPLGGGPPGPSAGGGPATPGVAPPTAPAAQPVPGTEEPSPPGDGGEELPAPGDGGGEREPDQEQPVRGEPR